MRRNWRRSRRRDPKVAPAPRRCSQNSTPTVAAIISESEFTTGMQNMKTQSQSASSTSSSDKSSEIFSKMDTNQDGTVSAEELAAYKEANGIEGGPGTEEMLARLDTDGSGDINESELAAGMKNMQANGPQGPPPGPPPEEASTTSTASTASTTSSTTTTASTSSGSTAATDDSTYNLNQLFNIAMQSYMQTPELYRTDRRHLQHGLILRLILRTFLPPKRKILPLSAAKSAPGSARD